MRAMRNTIGLLLFLMVIRGHDYADLLQPLLHLVIFHLHLLLLDHLSLNKFLLGVEFTSQTSDLLLKHGNGIGFYFDIFSLVIHGVVLVICCIERLLLHRLDSDVIYGFVQNLTVIDLLFGDFGTTPH